MNDIQKGGRDTQDNSGYRPHPPHSGDRGQHTKRPSVSPNRNDTKQNAGSVEPSFEHTYPYTFHVIEPGVPFSYNGHNYICTPYGIYTDDPNAEAHLRADTYADPLFSSGKPPSLDLDRHDEDNE